ncbi:extracellular calcium-sensing receptor-like [Hydra vulgaris]|uniref:Extracellular calcium-sensing receptor-like n=1 Tax=Hydra vulgaris TaxID=6087 RepID=A0ABM4BQ09_HYDVU
MYGITDKSSSTNFTQITSFLNGNYTIQIILTFTEQNSSCNKVSLSGLLAFYATKYAIDRANNNTQWKMIGARLVDNCGDLTTTMETGIKVISSVNIESNSVCREKYMQCSVSGLNFMKPPAAILGTDMSTTTIPLASLMSLYEIPMISPWASNRLLTDSTMYRSFLRTIPSDSMQVRVMLDVMKRFDWNYIFAVGLNDSYGKLALEDLQIQAAQNDIWISDTSYITYKGNDICREVNETLKKINNQPSATVVILFCYFSGLGEILLIEAEKANISRIWLTSDAWNPEALNKSYKHTVPKNQLHGLLSISMNYSTILDLSSYIENEIKTNYLVNNFLQNYLKNTFNCEPKYISNDKSVLYGENNCFIIVDDIKKQLIESDISSSNWVDAVTVLTNGIYSYIYNNSLHQCCANTPIDYTKLTQIMKNMSIKSSTGNVVTFNNSNDPVRALYNIDNLQNENGTLTYITIGSWSYKNNYMNFNILNKNIKWPYWYVQQNSSAPQSKCNRDCVNGEVVVSSHNTGCWTCINCSGFYNYTNTTNAKQCSTCIDGYHSINNNTACNKTDIAWLNYKSSEGVAIIVVSSIGQVLTLIGYFFLFKFRRFLPESGSYFFTSTFTCCLPFISFSYGYLNIVEPTNVLCSSRNMIFFILLMSYSSSLLVKTNMAVEYFKNKTIKYRLLTVQVFLITTMIFVELIPVFVLIFIHNQNINEEIVSGLTYFFKSRSCSINLNVPSLIANFIPLIILILASCCAFRERNMEHHFYEPKFFSFTCIALCVVMVAYLITFNFVQNKLKSIVMTFTLSIFGLIYTICLILPQIYIGYERHRQMFIKKRSKNKFGSKKHAQKNSSISVYTMYNY